MDLVYTLSLVALLIVCALMILLVLMQKPKQEGLGAAFGGGMTNEMFGAHTVTVLQKGTAGLAVAFFILLCLTAWSGSALEAAKDDSNTEQAVELEDYQAVAQEVEANPQPNEEQDSGAAAAEVGTDSTPEAALDEVSAQEENQSAPSDSPDQQSTEIQQLETNNSEQNPSTEAQDSIPAVNPGA